VLLFVFATKTDDWFSWTIKPPLTAAFLGASYWAAAVLFWWTLHRDDPRRVTVALLPVTVIGVLLLVATVIHWDRFHDDLFGWFWRVAYLTVPGALALVALPAIRAARAAAGRARSQLPGALRLLLALQGVVMVGVGVYLFLAPTSADALWPWDLTPLTARAVGAFVTGFGASALHAVAANDALRFEGAAFAYAALGALELLAVALHAGDLTGASGDSWLYVAFLASVLAAGLYGAAVARRLSPSPARR
jgi:hypothetical protein